MQRLEAISGDEKSQTALDGVTGVLGVKWA